MCRCMPSRYGRCLVTTYIHMHTPISDLKPTQRENEHFDRKFVYPSKYQSRGLLRAGQNSSLG
jgi:hypothetical protein